MTFPGPWPGPQPDPFSAPQFPPQQPPPPQQWAGPPGWGPPPPPPQWGSPGGPPYGGPPYGGAPYGGPPHGGPPPKRSGRKWIIAAIVGVLAVAGVAGGIWGYQHHQSEKQLAGIRDTVSRFAEASDTADTEKMSALMCAAEAEQFADGMEGTVDGGPIKAGERRAVNFGAISVDGDTATVEVTRPPSPRVTLKLLREGDSWKMCNPA
ncbi:Rv0361 family membrane protein [Mycolicibacterium arseniciresistens]|uniref:DUF4878 domain-containing protein n=1 Tax=Mycolicibacterium arseniciresistens TaxID=3062257 RepID=A0ABT8UF75_9MYCO|nr:hypothetical protein [Mycolicibacterium arseniciresistens]MDO3636426.1 hypothetical protein [Mycolicibacterium arseniciresistens]